VTQPDKLTVTDNTMKGFSRQQLQSFLNNFEKNLNFFFEDINICIAYEFP